MAQQAVIGTGGDGRRSHRGLRRDIPVWGSFMWGYADVGPDLGRIAGPAWVFLSIAFYVWYRQREGYPVGKSLARNWEAEQISILESAEEYTLLEEYRFALAAKEKTRTRQARGPTP